MHHTSKVSWLKPRLNFYCHFSKTKLKQLLNKAEFYTYFVFICNHNQKVTCTDDFSIMFHVMQRLVQFTLLKS